MVHVGIRAQVPKFQGWINIGMSMFTRREFCQMYDPHVVLSSVITGA
jgi:hypothetical protein